METKPGLRFQADFQCPTCGSIIGVSTYLAIVQGPGLEVACRHCRTAFVVTESEAQQIGPDMLGATGALPPLAGTYEIEKPPPMPEGL